MKVFIKRSFPQLFLISLILIMLSACKEASARSSEDIIAELIDGFGYCGERSDSETDALLKELAASNSEAAALWQDVLDYWKYVETEMPVNNGRLPEGLDNSDSLCIVVLGYELNSDGTMKAELIGRLNVALTCAQQYPNAYVLCTGGATAAENKSNSEAELMGAWLVEHGLDENRLIIENRSFSTVQNAQLTLNILTNMYPQIHSVAVVSSSYHITWGSLLFEAVFLKEAYEKGSEPVHIVSNAAYFTENDAYKDSLGYEARGLRSIFGIDN